MSAATLTAAKSRQAARLPSRRTRQDEAGRLAMFNPEYASDAGQSQSFKKCGAAWRPALNLLLLHRRGAANEVDSLLKDDAECVFGHCLRMALIVRGDDRASRWKLAASAAAIENTSSKRHDQAYRHAAAARAWLIGDQILAAERYGAIVVDWPRDILALVVAHALDFRLSRRLLLRDRIAQVLPEWEPGMQGYSSVLAMYAFGLEENGEYGRAEAVARRALAIDPEHPGAIHVIAHVMEMQGRVSEGLAFLASTEPAWSLTGFSIHLAWHRALLYLEKDDPGSALAVYDSQMAAGNVSDLAALADASALLWRLELRNIKLGERWQLLANRWKMQRLADAQPFYLVHAMMVFAAARRAANITRTLELLPPADVGRAIWPLTEEALAAGVCEALIAFAHGDYEACVEWLGRVRYIADRCGGSLAQCDVTHLTFTEAALRAGNASLARALVAERTAKKPCSPFNRILQQRLVTIMPATREKLVANGNVA